MASFYDISLFFSDNLQLIERGETHLKSSHLQSFSFDPENDEIRGDVQASLRDVVYSTWVRFKKKSISSAYCTCPKGNYKCSHMATILLYSVNNCSATDRPCEWNKPKGGAEKVCDNLFDTDTFVSLNRRPNEDDRNFLQSSLSSDSYTGLHWFLSPEPNVQSHENCTVLTFDDIDNLCEYSSLPDKIHFMIENLQVTDENINEVYNVTIGQRKNHLWGQFRKGRITSSNFGLVLAALSKGKITPSLLKTLKGEYFVENAKAVQWGIVHEKHAKKLYEEIKDVQVENAGFYLHQSGILGCSSDGIIGETILEIKCPFSKSNCNLIQIITEGKWFVKFVNNDMKAELREKDDVKVYVFPEGQIMFNLKDKQGHAYYHQVQGILHIMKKMSCDFLIWSPKMSVIFNVKKDESWSSNIDKLISFYKNVLIYAFF